MDESHVSCRDLYDCSSEKLDILVSLCKKNGAIGSRLTGAGWGGCTVSMVNSKDADNFIKIIKNEFYSDVENVDEYLFKSEIGKGAGVLKLV